MSENNGIFFVGVKGIVMNSKRDKVLLLRRPDRFGVNYWDVPGGKTKGEAINETMSREVKEELPEVKEITMGRLVGAFLLERTVDGVHGLLRLFYLIKTNLKSGRPNCPLNIMGTDGLVRLI